jgi:cytochrome c-type biogenesis protein CcmH/NrfG
MALTRDRPDDPDFLFAYGHVLFLETRFNEATAAFQRLLATESRHRRGAFGLARSFQEAGRRQEAIAAWEAYLLLDDSSARAEDARRNLARLRSE